MTSPPDSIGEGKALRFRAIYLPHTSFRSFVRPFDRTDLVTTISRKWLQQSWWNVREIFNSRL